MKMTKPKLFDEESDEEVSFKTENEYAKKYDKWREKEELYKLEQKYGDKALDPEVGVSSDSEDESDNPPEISEETETQFLKTLSLLKTKDPRIYNPSFKFFEEPTEQKAEEKPKVKTLTFEDSDDDDDYANDGNIFKIEKKANEIGNIEKEIIPEEGKNSKEMKLKEFLTGKAEHIDEDVERDLAPLKALWSDPKLNEGEAFLRDYILNKRYLEEGDAGEAEDKIRDDEDLEEDEKLVEEQGKFERAYNFRFEEPDEEYLKRFPRTMNFIRPKDERRARKRAEVRARKEEEKRRKMDEIQRMKALRLKEITEKIARIKEVTGNEQLAFREEDIEGDFDPEEHDRRMKALFDEQYYGEVDQEKPVFPDLDEELEIENWENYEKECIDEQAQNNEDNDLHCEDDDFNMDADYDPKQARMNLLEQLKETMGKKRRNRRKKSQLAGLLATEKPKFVPSITDKSYSEHMEEYYKMDCEDIIGGDLPTRFKYRQVVPNDYGLTVEEILLADDKELTQWVPLKKIVKHRPADVEKGEINTYKSKAADVNLKKKVLPSLFKDLPEQPEIVVPVEDSTKRKKKKRKKDKSRNETSTEDTNVINESVTTKDEVTDIVDANEEIINKSAKKKKKLKEQLEMTNKDENNVNDTEVDNNKDVKDEIMVKSKRKKKKHKEQHCFKSQEDNDDNSINNRNDEIIISSEDGQENIDGKLMDTEIGTGKRKKKNKKLESNGKEVIKNETNTLNSNLNRSKLTAKTQIDHGQNREVKLKKKKKKPDFVVEAIEKQEPSQGNGVTEGNKLKPNLKRKLEVRGDNETVKNKKKKKINNAVAKNVSKNMKRNMHDGDKANPLVKLSDERLKAYGLNPKKYKKFMKYKKF